MVILYCEYKLVHFTALLFDYSVSLNVLSHAKKGKKLSVSFKMLIFKVGKSLRRKNIMFLGDMDELDDRLGWYITK